MLLFRLLCITSKNCRYLGCMCFWIVRIELQCIVSHSLELHRCSSAYLHYSVVAIVCVCVCISILVCTARRLDEYVKWSRLSIPRFFLLFVLAVPLPVFPSSNTHTNTKHKHTHTHYPNPSSPDFASDQMP